MRQSGVLMHMTSLPSPGGVGTLGKEAYAFADFMEKAGLRVWQMLPIGPTGYGESPYQSGSTHAGNPMLIDLELLREEGLLDAELPDPASDPTAWTFPMCARARRRCCACPFSSRLRALRRTCANFPRGRRGRRTAKETSTGWTPTPSTPPSRMPAAELCGRSGRNNIRTCGAWTPRPLRRAPTFTATASGCSSASGRR